MNYWKNAKGPEGAPAAMAGRPYRGFKPKPPAPVAQAARAAARFFSAWEGSAGLKAVSYNGAIDPELKP
jgi:hypothetical protein